MFIRKVWQQITRSGRTCEIHAAAQRECALREEFARRVRGLESQILLLRAENRALLNSVLGIAGIPPIMVTEPAELPFAAAAIQDVHHPTVSSRQRTDVWPDEGTAVGVVGQEPKQIPRTASRALGNRGNCDEARDFARDDSSQNSDFPQNGAVSLQADGVAAPLVESAGRRAGGHVVPNGNGLPSTVAGHSSAVPLRKKNRTRTAKEGRIVAPMRRRSWHQIYRMLELESTRRKGSEA